ncbi:MAG: diaminopimelate epimerase [Prevotellaceae bacterium]|nr:diaminopimelate epimerase [Prevotellaceae bacterium]
MRDSIKFTKMHGAGNDYIYVNTLLYNIEDPAQAAIEWSKPHFGVGSDGLILIGEATDGESDFSMRIFNNDGSEAMMCGNGTRCVAKFVHDKGLTSKNPILLQTLSGQKVLHLHLDNEGLVESVTVDMGEPMLRQPEQYIDQTDDTVKADFRSFRGTFVSMGNPHFVTFVDDIDNIDIEKYGKVLEHHEAFPQRCNIEFAQLVGTNAVRTRVWERGSGITMACGTGACATAVASFLTGRADRQVDIIMDGGTLHIEWREDDNHIYMTGPAAISFEGEIAKL